MTKLINASLIASDWTAILDENGQTYKVTGTFLNGLYLYEDKEFDTFKELGEYLCLQN